MSEYNETPDPDSIVSSEFDRIFKESEEREQAQREKWVRRDRRFLRASVALGGLSLALLFIGVPVAYRFSENPERALRLEQARLAENIREDTARRARANAYVSYRYRVTPNNYGLTTYCDADHPDTCIVTTDTERYVVVCTSRGCAAATEPRDFLTAE